MLPGSVKFSHHKAGELGKPDHSPLFQIPGVAGPTVAVGFMHNKYLASDMYAFGGLWYYLCFHLLPKSPHDNLQDLWLELKGLYKQLNTRHRYNYFNKLTMFVKKTGPPKLRGRAAEVKGMAEPMLHFVVRAPQPQHCPPQADSDHAETECGFGRFVGRT